MRPHPRRARAFCSPFENHRRPPAALRESAHAYHDRVLGFGDARVAAAAWRRFRDGGKHKAVLTSPGAVREHYGLTDAKAFAAAMTEACPAANDFSPFVAGELKQAEPEVFALTAEVWGPPPGPRNRAAERWEVAVGPAAREDQRGTSRSGGEQRNRGMGGRGRRRRRRQAARYAVAPQTKGPKPRELRSHPGRYAVVNRRGRSGRGIESPGPLPPPGPESTNDPALYPRSPRGQRVAAPL